MAGEESKCRVMMLVIEKIGHLGHEVFAGGAGGGTALLKGLKIIADNLL